MHKRILTFLSLLLIAAFIYWKGEELSLAFLILFPLVIFPVFYLSDFERRRFLFFVAAVALLLFAIGLYRHQSQEVLFLGIGTTLLLGALLYYRMLWQGLLREESENEQKVQEGLESLKRKYETRLESLLRLEKQVSSLMGLFEIARDFSECLSLETMSRLLRERIMPELPFVRLCFVTVDLEEPQLVIKRKFTVTQTGAVESNPDFSDEETEVFKAVFETKQMLKRTDAQSQNVENWIFPLVLDGRVAAMMWVEGALAEDLVRFEVLVAHLILQLKKIQLYETVKSLAIVDGLTGLYVRRYFLERFTEEVQRSIRFGLPLAVLMLDIDHFKRYNDELGHLVGDATLKEVAAILRNNLRKVDVVARYGGEEFIAVLPETTGKAAVEVAERIRSSIARHRFRVYDVEAKATVSLGISLYPDDIPADKRKEFYPDLGFDLIRHADRALYRAKEEGRNRIYRYQEI